MVVLFLVTNLTNSKINSSGEMKIMRSPQDHHPVYCLFRKFYQIQDINFHTSVSILVRESFIIPQILTKNLKKLSLGPIYFERRFRTIVYMKNTRPRCPRCPRLKLECFMYTNVVNVSV